MDTKFIYKNSLKEIAFFAVSFTRSGWFGLGAKLTQADNKKAKPFIVLCLAVLCKAHMHQPLFQSPKSFL